MRKWVSVLLGATLISTVVYPVNWARAENPKKTDYYAHKTQKPALPKSKIPDAPKPTKMPVLKGQLEPPPYVTTGVIGAVAGAATLVLTKNIFAAAGAAAVSMGTWALIRHTLPDNKTVANTLPPIVSPVASKPPTQNPQSAEKEKPGKESVNKNKEAAGVSENKSQKLDKNKNPPGKENPENTAAINDKKGTPGYYAQIAEKHPALTAMVIGAVAGGATLAVTGNPVLAAGVGVAAAVITRAAESPKIRETIKKEALDHPNIAAVVAGTVAGGATLLATKSLGAAAGVGVATGAIVRESLIALAPDNKAKACPPSAPPTKKPHHHKKPTTTKQPASTPSSTTTKAPENPKTDSCAAFKLPPADPKTFNCNCPIPPPPASTASSQNEKPSACASAAQVATDLGVSPMPGMVAASSNEGKAPSSMSQCAGKLAGSDSKSAPPSSVMTDPWFAVRSFCAPTPTPAPQTNPSPIITNPNPGTAVPSPATTVNNSSGTIDDSKNASKDDSKSKLPWTGMGLVGAYGALLGSLLLGPIGLFIFGVIGIGVGYLISQ